MPSNITTLGAKKLSKRYFVLSFLRCIKNSIASIIGLAVLIILVLQAIAPQFLDEYHLIMGIVLIIIVFSANIISTILHYACYSFELCDKEIIIKSGILFKSQTHIPYNKIHSVNKKAGFLNRLFDIFDITFDTAGGIIDDEEDMTIPGLSESDAESIKDEVFRRKDEVSPGKNEAQPISVVTESDDTTPEYKLTTKELSLLCMTNSKVFALIFAVISFIISRMDDLDIFNINADQLVDRAGEFILRQGINYIIGIALIVFVIAFIVSAVMKGIAFGNFTVKRTAQRIEVSRGEFEHKMKGVSIDRIQSLRISQNMLSRFMGYLQVSVAMASSAINFSDDEDDDYVIIHPFIKKDNLNHFMEQILPEFNNVPRDLKPLSKVARTRSIRRYFVVALALSIIMVSIVASLTSIKPSILIIVALIFLSLMTLAGWASWKGKAYARSSKYVAIRDGLIARRINYIPKLKIQRAHVSQSPFQKKAGMTTITAFYAGGGLSELSLRDLSITDAEDYFDWVASSTKKIINRN